MTQSSLLELAKSGNPQAIASLMNQVLEPKGVIAKTQLEGDCLHIVFMSEHLLSQSAIASFVKNGLSTLGTKSFQTIKLYAQKIGQDSPLWVDSFSLNQAISTQAAPPISQPVAPPPLPKPPASLPAVNSSPPSPPEAPPTRPVAAKRYKAKPSSAKTHRGPSKPIPQAIYQIRRIARLDKAYKLAIAVSAGAFFVGGSVALLMNIQAKSSSYASLESQDASVPLSSQSLVAPNSAAGVNSLETQVETYLRQMNQAQQAFYQANGRFAASLEELERSASVMSHSSNYTYRLVLREQSQSVLTATPKQERLMSYSATVLATDPAQATPTSAIICKTNQPSTFPPILAQAAVLPIQCPADATQVLR